VGALVGLGRERPDGAEVTAPGMIAGALESALLLTSIAPIGDRGRRFVFPAFVRERAAERRPLPSAVTNHTGLFHHLVVVVVGLRL
jgi:hypothetical protein